MERCELFNGEVVMHYYDDDHNYVWNGTELPSSTAISGILHKPGLRYWYINQALAKVQNKIQPNRVYDEIELAEIFDNAKYSGKEFKDRAANIGKLIHRWIEDYINGHMSGATVTPSMPSHTGARGAVENYMRWEDKVKPEYIFSERRMISRKHNFAGTMDIAALIDGRPTVIDIKSGKRVYPEYWLQTASYACMLDEERPKGWDYDLEDTERLILILNQAEGTTKPQWAKSDILMDTDVFLALRTVYRWKYNK